MILKEALFLAMGGITLGMPLVLALGYASRALLYGVDSFDPAAFTIALLVLLASGIFVGVAPASRAGRLHPASALRCE
jgi:putative ABC transport system permease protein